jgi:hypothetical protein
MHPALRTETPDDLQSEDLISMRRVSLRYGRGHLLRVGIDVLGSLPIRTTYGAQ